MEVGIRVWRSAGAVSVGLRSSKFYAPATNYPRNMDIGSFAAEFHALASLVKDPDEVVRHRAGAWVQASPRCMTMAGGPCPCAQEAAPAPGTVSRPTPASIGPKELLDVKVPAPKGRRQ